MSTKAKRPTYLLRVGMAHKRLVISVPLGLVTTLALPAPPITRMLIGWDTGVLLYLVAAAVVMSRCSSVAQMQANAAAQDEGAFAILILTVAAAMASLGAIFAELATIERTTRTMGSMSRSPSAPWCCPGHSPTPSSRCTTPTISTATGLRKNGLTVSPATASPTTGTSSISPSSSA